MPTENLTEDVADTDVVLTRAGSREAALREVLEVIESSRDDEKPVFDVLLKNAALLCDAPLAFATMVSEDGTCLEYKGLKGKGFDDLVEYLTESPLPMDPKESATAWAVIEGRTIAYDDYREGPEAKRGSAVSVQAIALTQMRSMMLVPLIRDGVGIGAINIWHRELRPFTADQIALVETFAAQAVIAVENVRQFRELQTRLEREAATREILQVISQSRDDDQPVFERIAQQAAKLCGAERVGLHIIDANDLNRGMFMAQWGPLLSDFVPGEFTYPLDRPNPIPSAIRETEIRHITDLREEELYRAGDAAEVKIVNEEGFRTLLAVPLMTGDASLGAIALWRTEVKPFSEDEITLARGFAAQAVIAIENDRQFRELQIRLEREAATSEILSVISQSRDDEDLVFNVVIEKAATLCEADQSALILANEERTKFYLAADWGHTKTETRIGQTWPYDSTLTAGVAIRTAELLHIPDYAETENYKSGDPAAVNMVETEGIRTRLIVRLMRGKIAIGAITLSRREVRPFSVAEVKLVETFAAQSVIAIENTRQFREVQDRLEREKASAEILEVISKSRDDEQPVLTRSSIVHRSFVMPRMPGCCCAMTKIGT